MRALVVRSVSTCCALLLLACQGEPACPRDGGACVCDASCPEPHDADQARSDCGTQDEPQACDDLSALRRVIEQRRSFRNFSDGAITRDDVLDLVWAAQGITDEDNGFRASPSAGATYPLEVYVAADRVDGLDPGVYHYDIEDNALVASGATGPLGDAISAAAVDQVWVRTAAANIVFAAVYERTTERYDVRGYRYVDMEAGHAAQNLLLMATARGLGSVPIGAFDNVALADVLGLPEGQDPVYFVCVGQKQ